MTTEVNLYFTPSDTHERHVFIDHSIEDTIRTLQDPQIASELGSHALKFIAELESAIITNISHGVVSVPAGTSPEELLFTGIRPGETLLSDTTLGERTPEQKRAIIEQFKTWLPRNLSAEELYEEAYLTYGADSEIIGELTLSPYAAAQTSYFAHVQSGRDQLASQFVKAPSKGLIVSKSRPQVLLKVEPDKQLTLADAVVHELVHVKQGIERPVEHVRSQEHADNLSLRVELEAYHLGAVVTLHTVVMESQAEPINVEDLARTYRGIQIVMQLLREEVGYHPSDPYNPSKKMMAAIKNKQLEYAIHADLNFSALLEACRRSKDINYQDL
ncbi:MAG: hypothetical protein QFB87_02760 [Patescibacteria group bacterium]|nr:hypothetical protein [Patescibacteria group bacterium]